MNEDASDFFPDVRVFIRRFHVWSAGLTAIATLLCLFWSLWDLALGVALGALVFATNLTVFAQSLRDLEPSEGSETDGEGSDRSRLPPRRAKKPRWATHVAVRLPLVALALAFILWYMPARPEGVALGVILVLIAAILAARGAARQTTR